MTTNDSGTSSKSSKLSIAMQSLKVLLELLKTAPDIQEEILERYNAFYEKAIVSLVWLIVSVYAVSLMANILGQLWIPLVIYFMIVIFALLLLSSPGIFVPIVEVAIGISLLDQSDNDGEDIKKVLTFFAKIFANTLLIFMIPIYLMTFIDLNGKLYLVLLMTGGIVLLIFMRFAWNVGNEKVYVYTYNTFFAITLFHGAFILLPDFTQNQIVRGLGMTSVTVSEQSVLDEILSAEQRRKQMECLSTLDNGNPTTLAILKDKSKKEGLSEEELACVESINQLDVRQGVESIPVIGNILGKDDARKEDVSVTVTLDPKTMGDYVTIPLTNEGKITCGGRYAYQLLNNSAYIDCLGKKVGINPTDPVYSPFYEDLELTEDCVSRNPELLICHFGQLVVQQTDGSFKSWNPDTVYTGNQVNVKINIPPAVRYKTLSGVFTVATK